MLFVFYFVALMNSNRRIETFNQNIIWKAKFGRSWELEVSFYPDDPLEKQA